MRGQKRVSNDEGELGMRKFVFPGAVKLNLHQPCSSWSCGWPKKCELIGPLWCWGSECQVAVSSLLWYKGARGKQNEDLDLRKRNRVLLGLWRRAFEGLPEVLVCSKSAGVKLHDTYPCAAGRRSSGHTLGWFYGNPLLDLQLTYIFIATTGPPEIRSAFCCSKFLSILQPLLPL